VVLEIAGLNRQPYQSESCQVTSLFGVVLHTQVLLSQ